jgi:hypothetical protein
MVHKTKKIKGYFEFEFSTKMPDGSIKWQKHRDPFEAENLFEIRVQENYLKKFGGNMRNIKTVFKGN